MTQVDIFSPIKSVELDQDIYTVSRLNFEVASVLSGNFPSIWITGEISNLSTPPSGHIYFVLKDAKSQVQCAMFRAKQKLTFTPENGQKVLLQAQVNLYEPRGSYQLNAIKMTLAGDGELQQQFNELKNKLQQNGWFDESLKKPLPAMPNTVGIITSPDGAVIHDMKTVFKRRLPLIKLVIYPTIVQGATAAKNIAKMIKIANQRQECEVLIVGRGGGSLEDLWAFNELAVAEAIYQSELPIVSAIGHESDITIADFVSDKRAPTPSAAAELLSPNMADLQNSLLKYQNQLQQKIQHILSAKQQQILLLNKSLNHPKLKIDEFNLKLDELFFKLMHFGKQKLSDSQVRLNELSVRLNAQNPQVILNTTTEKLHNIEWQLTSYLPRIDLLNKQLTELERRLILAQQNHHLKIKNLIQNLSARLDIASPLKTLSRGYTITYDADGKVLRDGNMVKKSDKIWVRFEKTALLAIAKKTVTIES